MRKQLHKMGFPYCQSSKGVYFYGHEREDVVKDRREYLDVTPSECPPPTISTSPPIIRVFHDELTFHANSNQSFRLSNGSNQALKQKSLGQAVMVSDFIDGVDGYLTFEEEEARLYLEHQTEGYFTNDMFLDQVGKAVDSFESMYPGAVGMFIVDNAPSH